MASEDIYKRYAADWPHGPERERYPVLFKAVAVARFLAYAGALVAVLAAIMAVIAAFTPGDGGVAVTVCLSAAAWYWGWLVLSDVFSAIVETERNTRRILDLTIAATEKKD